MIKEFLTLILLLFSKNSINFEETEKMRMEYFPLQKDKYLSWCGYIITKEEELEMTLPSWIHENIHLYQAKKYGWWGWYYLNYLWDILVGIIFIWSIKGAYKTSRFELEACVNQDKGWDYIKEVNPIKYYFTPLQRRFLWKNWENYKKILL